jgi:hypothetical protein
MPSRRQRRLRIGQTVEHAKFGIGVIVSTEGAAPMRGAGQFRRQRHEVAGAGIRQADAGVRDCGKA